MDTTNSESSTVTILSQSPSGTFRRPDAPSIRRAVIVVKETYLDQVRASGDQQLLDDIAARKPGVESVQESHEQHERCIAIATEALTANGITLVTIHRNSETLKDHLVGIDLVVTIGGDGTFLRASHEVGANIPVVGVNSAPITSFGHYCCTDSQGFPAVLASILSGAFQPSRLMRLNLAINKVAIPEPVLNEVLVAHVHRAGTSRYQLTVGSEVVQHKGSGLLIAAPGGTTGFLRSEGGTILPITARQYSFVERAPFLGLDEEALLKTGVVDGSDTLSIVSHMQDGKLSIDGEHIEYDFPRGATLTVSAGANDLLAYVNPDCHRPYLAKSRGSGLAGLIKSLLGKIGFSS